MDKAVLRLRDTGVDQVRGLLITERTVHRGRYPEVCPALIYRAEGRLSTDLRKSVGNSESTSGFFVGSGRIASFKPLIQRYRAAIKHAMQGIFPV